MLITTDSILYAVHKSFDDALMALETSAFRNAIDRVLGSAHGALRSAPPAGEAAKDADIYLTVARSLLAGAAGSGRDSYGRPATRVSSAFGQDGAVEAILARIQALSMQPPTRLYGSERMVDWSQFRPRGHYTKSEELARYFRAMMWLGRADLAFHVSKSPRELAAAIAVADAVRSSSGLEALRSLGEAVDCFVG